MTLCLADGSSSAGHLIDRNSAVIGARARSSPDHREISQGAILRSFHTALSSSLTISMDAATILRKSCKLSWRPFAEKRGSPDFLLGACQAVQPRNRLHNDEARGGIMRPAAPPSPNGFSSIFIAISMGKWPLARRLAPLR